jgi:lysophospholipase L1-like esterase
MVSGLSGLAHYPYTELHALVAAFCEEQGIEHLDLLPRFLGQDERSLWVHPTDQHPNDKGQRLIGEGVLEYLAPR